MSKMPTTPSERGTTKVDLATKPVWEAPPVTLPSEPFYFRLPKPGENDPYFGGSRTFWNQRILPGLSSGKPDVESVVQRSRSDARRGTRFINFASAKAYFQKLAEKQAA
jgi:hypothetical protein